MRIFFLLLQAFILMTLGAAVASLLNEFALHIGGATSQALILLCLLADGGVLFSGPFVALAAAMFIFLLLSGYRMLRWTRWLGVALNLGLIWPRPALGFSAVSDRLFRLQLPYAGTGADASEHDPHPALGRPAPRRPLGPSGSALSVDGPARAAAPLTLACVLPLVFLFRANRKPRNAWLPTAFTVRL